MTLFRSLGARLRKPWKSCLDDASTVDLIFLLGLGLVLFTSGLGLRHPWPADEPRFALIAREMVETGQWFFPHRASEIYAHKPPLFMWAIALGYKATGSLRFAFLLPSLIAGLGVLVLVYDLARRLWHRRAGLAAGFALLCIVQFPLQVKVAQIDASVTFWTTLGLYGLCRHLLLGSGLGWWCLGFFAMGLGVITKGVGFLPLLVLLPWAWACWQGWRPFSWVPRLAAPRLTVAQSRWRWVLGPLVLFVAIGLWLVPMLVLVERGGDPSLVAYRNEILWGQTAQRYTSFQGHQRPFWYYPAQVIPSLWMPASLLLPWLVPAWARRLKRRDTRYLLLLGWVVLVVLFFTFSSGKRGVYILPAVPALAVVCGPLVAAGLGRLAGPRWAAFSLLLLLSAVFLAAGIGGLSGAEWALEIAEKQHFEPWSLVIAVGLVGLTWAVTLRPRHGLAALAGFLGCCWLLYGWWGYALLDPVRSSSRLMRNVSERIGPDSQLAMVGWKEQMILQADRPVTHWGYLGDHEPTPNTETQVHRAAQWLLAEGRPGPGRPRADRVVLVPLNWSPNCIDTDRIERLGYWHGQDWVLWVGGAVLETCRMGEAEEIPVYTSFWVPEASTGDEDS